MESRKAEKLERHKREIKHRAYLNLFLVTAFSIGLGVFLGGPTLGFLSILIGDVNSLIAVSGFFLLLAITWCSPVLHYREKMTVRSNKDRDYYMDRGMDKLPLIELLEDEGWDEVEKDEKRIKLETYPSIIHRKLGKKSTMEFEITEKEGNQETVILRKNGREREKIRSTFTQEEDGSKIKETGVSMARTSPAYLEIMMFVLPQIQETLQEVAEEKLELLDENLEIGFREFKIEE
jgi:hypothetical protein